MTFTRASLTHACRVYFILFYLIFLLAELIGNQVEPTLPPSPAPPQTTFETISPRDLLTLLRVKATALRPVAPLAPADADGHGGPGRHGRPLASSRARIGGRSARGKSLVNSPSGGAASRASHETMGAALRHRRQAPPPHSLSAPRAGVRSAVTAPQQPDEQAVSKSPWGGSPAADWGPFT